MTEQLTLFNLAPVQVIRTVTDPYWDEIVNEVALATISPPVKPLVGGQVISDTEKVAPQHDTHWIERYWVERSENKYWYYRYCWMIGRKIHRLYIGSVHSPKAQAKKELIEIAIADGETPLQIKQMLRGHKNASTMPTL